jgi:NADH-quinone oxidoreductase subunit M
MYLLLMVGKVVWGPLVEPHGHGHAHGHSDGHDSGSNSLPRDLNIREIGVLVPLAVMCLVMGIYPKPFLKALEGPVNSTVKVVNAATSQGIKLGSSTSLTPVAAGHATQGHAQ